MSPATPAQPTPSVTFAERLRAATERQQQEASRPRFRWLRGTRAGFPLEVAVEPHDRPRQRDEFVHSIRDAG